MKRDSGPTILYKEKEEPFYHLLAISQHLISLLLKQSNPMDLIALYNFYYYTAKWQKTNRPKATIAYTSEKTKWGRDKIRANKKKLIELGLIEDVQTRNNKNIIIGHYIQVNFIWKESTLLKTHPLENKEGINIKTLNTNNNSPKQRTSGGVRKIEKEKRNEKFTQLSNRLSQIIQLSKNIKHTPLQIKAWTNEMRRLEEDHKVGIDRIQKAIIWYSKHIGEQYVPVIESGRSFRSKFMSLENAIDREKHPYENNLKPETKTDYGQRWHLQKDGKYRNKDGQLLM